MEVEEEPTKSADSEGTELEIAMKKRKIHMEVQDCFAHAQTEEGVKPLSSPLRSSLTSSNRPNLGLNPRSPRIKGVHKTRDHITHTPHTPVAGPSLPQNDACTSSSSSSGLGASLVAAYRSKTPGGFGSASHLCASSVLPELSALQKVQEENNIRDNAIDLSSRTGTVDLTLPEKTEHVTGTISASSSEGRDTNSSAIVLGSIQGAACMLDSSIVGQGVANRSYTVTNVNKTPNKSCKNYSKKSKKQTIPPSQSRLTSFFGSSPSSNPDSGQDDDFDSLYGKTVSSYTPIKQVEGSSAIFISDTESPDFHSGQKSSRLTSSLENTPTKCSPEELRENAAVKKLFEGQKILDANPNLKPGKSLRGNSVGLHKSYSKKTNFSSKKTTKVENLKEMDVDDNFSSSDDESMFQALDSVTAADTFGLLGNGTMGKKVEEVKIDYFGMLPTEVMEHIFCHLPMLDLCLNSNRVCKRWSEIISGEKFMPWKKLYHKLKKNVEGTKKEVQDELLKYGMMSPSVFLLKIISCMKNIKPVTASNMTQCLQSHPKYLWAKALLEERLPECISHQELNPWSVITCLVIVADSVLDIQRVIRGLTCPSSDCTTQEVLECLYRLATFLQIFKQLWPHGPWHGIHYRLFYALYLYENASSAILGDLKGALSGKSGQQSMVKYGCAEASVRLTHEQMRVVNHNCRPGEVAKIVAFAGTGKTTTLVRYTQLRPQIKFLLVIFNKSACEYAKTIFPRNVDCKTGHGLAFGRMGFRYRSAGKFKGYGPTVFSITQTLQTKKGDNLFVRAKFVLDTLNTFLASADPVPTEAHVPSFRMDESGSRVFIEPQKRKMYTEDTIYLWSRMQDLDDKKVPMSHDGYLKLYQLSSPRLHYTYDCILIDEAQDLTPALSDILLSQNMAKILVGDPHQQIYSFRGAVNSMQTVQANTIFYLTQSFRFGPEIAEIAACCLEILKNEKKKTLVGNGQPCKVLGERVGQLAVLTRCNFTLFNEAVTRCCHQDTEEKIAFVGGTDGFGFSMIMDIYMLMLTPEERRKEVGREIENKMVKSFTSLGELEKYATKTQDNELLGKIKIVRTHHHNLPTFLPKILRKTIRDIRMADVVLSTAHKSKGLEFSTVHLTDDYITYIQLQQLEIQIMNTPLRLPSEDESNLLYVAVTRAKNALIMSPTLYRLLNRAGCKFEFPVLSSQLKEKDIPFKCVKTGAEFKPYALTLQKRDVKMSNGGLEAGGVYSPAILKDDNIWYHLLGTTQEDKKKEEEYEEARRN